MGTSYLSLNRNEQEFLTVTHSLTVDYGLWQRTPTTTNDERRSEVVK